MNFVLCLFVGMVNYLPALNVRDLKSERLSIIISYKNEEKLLGVPKLENSSGKEQAMAV